LKIDCFIFFSIKQDANATTFSSLESSFDVLFFYQAVEAEAKDLQSLEAEALVN